MMKRLKQWLLAAVAWVNVVLVVLMLLTGYSDRIDPESHPFMAYAGLVFPFLVLANVLMLCFWTLVAWRRLWIPVGGLLLAYTPINIYAPVRVEAQQPEYDLKVLSWNVGGYGLKPGRGDSFDSIFSYIREQQADIVCIEEDNETGRDRETSYAQHFAHSSRVKISIEGSKWPNHVALHSRFPIVHSERIDAPTVTHVNGAAAFYVDTGADTILVVGCHLENIHLDSKDRQQYRDILRGDMQRDTAKAEGKVLLTKFSGAYQARAAQVKAVHRYIEEHRGRHRVIVCGDFNDTPLSFTRHTLCQGLTDCFVESGSGLGLSYNQKGFNFRIDHFLCSSDLLPQKCKVDSKIAQSDHYPVLCWLKMGLKP